jgi:hypothetical protein
VVLQVRRLRRSDHRFSLRPHLGRGAIARRIAECLPVGLDPEKALYDIVPALDPRLRSVDYPNHRRMIIDMGSKWKKAFGKVKQARTGQWLEVGGDRWLRRIDYGIATLKWELVLLRLERLRWALGEPQSPMQP